MAGVIELRAANRKIRDLEGRANRIEVGIGALRTQMETQRREVGELKSQGFDRMVLLEDVIVRLAERVEKLEDKLSRG